MRTLFAALAGLGALVGHSVVAAPTVAGGDAPQVHRLVVRYKAAAAAAERERFVGRFATRQGLAARTHRTMASGAVVYRLSAALPAAEARELARRLSQQPEVASAEPDVRVQALAAAPNDPSWLRQWNLQPAGASTPGGAAFTGAWTRTLGGGVTVAVVDTGIVPSQDLATQVMPGVDLVTDDAISGDAAPGRDSDPSDPGDGCDVKNADGTVLSRNASSWHGVRVASIVAAAANNGWGISGAAPGASIQPVRVLGRCGGWLSDIADGIAWAAGAPVAGMPANATPARVINISAGGSGTCPNYMQDAITAANARKAVVVVAAGNSATNALMTPANCSGVLVVAAHTKGGDLASYSTFGPAVTLTAPAGGRCAAFTGDACATDPVPAIGNTGLYEPAQEDPDASFSGTSAATPHVSAAVAMILALRPELGMAEVRSILTRSAAAHPAGSFCAQHAVHCGAGMLDAGAAVALAASSTTTPVVEIRGAVPLYRRNAGLDLQAVAVGASDFTYRWQQVSGPALATLTPAGAAAHVVTPTAASGQVVVEVTATSASQPAISGTARVLFDVNEPPVVPALTLSAASGKAMDLALGITDPDDTALSIALSGTSASGLAVQSDGGGRLVWPAPVAGRYAFQVVATDALGNTRSNNVTLTIDGAPQVTPTGAGGGGGSDAPGGGGGGAVGGVFLALLALATLLLVRSAPVPPARRAAVRPARRA